MKIKFVFLVLIGVFLASCNGIPGADARKYPANPEERVKKNLAEGKGFTLNKQLGNVTRGGTFDFASSNELWRASLDVIDFMPLTSVNYSGGIIITDWYSENNSNESIKISVRFLTNELRADALDIKVFTRTCANSLLNCKIIETDGIIVSELKREILKKAVLYKKEDKNKKK
tara:strand:- start:138 stop:656 length:519 start_codon:yes stop_codon:yes gene_type:complete